jgi:hypothetical protein
MPTPKAGPPSSPHRPGPAGWPPRWSSAPSPGCCPPSKPPAFRPPRHCGHSDPASARHRQGSATTNSTRRWRYRPSRNTRKLTGSSLIAATTTGVRRADLPHRHPTATQAPSRPRAPIGGSACASAPKDWDGALLPCLSVSGGNRSTKRRLWVAGSQVDFAGSCTYAFHFGAACYW